MDATMENKMGLPPSYQEAANQVPPPSYFGNSPPPPPGIIVQPTAPMPVPQVPQRTAVIGPQKMGPGPTGTICTTCNKQIVTRVEYTANTRTHIVSAALCVLGGCCCACFVPYCMPSCKTANHFCPHCKAYVGSYIP